MVDLRRAAKPWSFYGKQQILIGSDLHWSLQKLDLFSAWAYQPQGVWAAIGGGRWQLGKLRFYLGIRRFGAGYYSLFGAAFSAAGMENEKGVLITIQSRWKKFRWRMFFDHYGRLAISPTQPQTRARMLYGLEVKRRLPLNGHINVFFQRDHFKRWRRGGALDEQGYRVRTEAIYEIASTTELKGRLEIRRVKTTKAKIVTSRLVSMRLRRQYDKLSSVLHVSCFKVPTYVARIYEYENTMPGTVNIPPLYGYGWRFYALVNIRLGVKQYIFRYRWKKVRRQRAEHQWGVQIDWQY